MSVSKFMRLVKKEFFRRKGGNQHRVLETIYFQNLAEKSVMGQLYNGSTLPLVNDTSIFSVEFFISPYTTEIYPGRPVEILAFPEFLPLLITANKIFRKKQIPSFIKTTCSVL